MPTGAAPSTGRADTGAMVFSVTKGMASTVIHRLADRGLIDYDSPVAEYWPEFGANGKADITVREVMRHRAGLSQLNGVEQGRVAGPPWRWRSGSRPRPSTACCTESRRITR